MIRDLLRRHAISQTALAAAAGLSRGSLHRLVSHGELPVRDPGAGQRIVDYLVGRGVDRAALENLFAQHKKPAPDVQQHAGAIPEAPITATQEETMLLRFESLSRQAREHFGLPRSPFVDEVRSLDDIFASPNTRYVRAALLDAALNHGFLAIVGESGAGKSTLVEELQERLIVEGRQVIIIRPYVLAMEGDDRKGKTLKSGSISQAIIRTLDPSATVRRTDDARDNQAETLLKSSRLAGYSHLLLIEEAHCLPKATLKHLKRFLEIKHRMGRLLGVCLVGQPELLALLSDKSPEVREVVQRCEIVELLPLDNDLDAYLKHKFARMEIAVGDILAADACDALRARLIHIPRGGKPADAVSLCYPLVVNNLLARAMNAAAAAGWPKVDAQVIGRC